MQLREIPASHDASPVVQADVVGNQHPIFVSKARKLTEVQYAL
jgi:hypothetical protein